MSRLVRREEVVRRTESAQEVNAGARPSGTQTAYTLEGEWNAGTTTPGGTVTYRAIRVIEFTSEGHAPTYSAIGYTLDSSGAATAVPHSDNGPDAAKLFAAVVADWKASL